MSEQRAVNRDLFLESPILRIPAWIHSDRGFRIDDGAFVERDPAGAYQDSSLRTRAVAHFGKSSRQANAFPGPHYSHAKWIPRWLFGGVVFYPLQVRN